MTTHKIISLTTDFGLEDHFVGVMKGVILGVEASAKLIDITHKIAPQNLLQCYYVLRSSFSFFPQGTVHLAVVDPGVGTNRRAIVVKSKDYFFVGPDNGIFSFCYNDNSIVIEIAEKKFFRSNISSSFHGRDIFAPIAAYIIQGVPIEKMGPRISDPQHLSPVEPNFSEDIITGEVIHVDRFGNLITNISPNMLDRLKTGNFKDSLKFTISGKSGNLTQNYTLGNKNHLSALVNSWGLLEIFLKQGNAKEELRLGIKEKVTVSIPNRE